MRSRAGGLTPPGEMQREELKLIRDALSDAIESSSLRSVARELGMSPSGLRGMLDGADPYGKTWEKARVWYVAHVGRAGEPPPLDADLVAALFDTLLGPIPVHGRTEARERVLRGFEESFESAGVQPPAWARELRARGRRSS